MDKIFGCAAILEQNYRLLRIFVQSFINWTKKFEQLLECAFFENLLQEDYASGPPLGSFVATKGVTPMDLSKKWNEKTKDYKVGTPLAGLIEFQGGKNFDVSFEGPPIEWLVRQAAGASTEHPSCMPEIASCLPANPVGMESVHMKELEFHNDYIKRWEESLNKLNQTDGILTLKHIYHIAELKMKDNKYKHSGMTLEQMCRKVINKAYECGIEVSQQKNISPEEYSRTIQDINERDERLRQEKLRKEEEEAELRRQVAKERKMAMNQG